MSEPTPGIIDAFRAYIEPALTTGTLADRVAALNAIRERIHKVSPFAGEPVDLVQWVPIDQVQANDYNPNTVAPPEMELLRLSIAADGYTQPIVTNQEDGTRVVIDGFHRNRVGRECEDVAQRIQGYLPVVQIRADRTDKPDRIASTIRHNRARGKHRVNAMTDIVVELKGRHWTDEKIGRELGMEPDEVLRLCQVAGLAELFADDDFSASCLLRNDHWCKTLGQAQPKSDAWLQFKAIRATRREREAAELEVRALVNPDVGLFEEASV